MKKSGICVAICMMAMLLAVSCSRQASDYTASSDEIVLPEDSAIPDATSTMEKIINKEDIIEIPQSDETKQEEEADSPSQVEVTIFYVFNDYSEFVQSKELLREDYTADELLSELAVHNIVPVDIKTIDMQIVTDTDGTKGIELDLKGSLPAYLGTMSDNAREAVISSIANTFIYNYDVDYIHLTVNGKTIGYGDEQNEDRIYWAESPIISK